MEHPDAVVTVWGANSHRVQYIPVRNILAVEATQE
jgi:hypothetical protein